MSEPTAAQEAYAADMALDAQIDDWYDANRKPVNQPPEETPAPEPPPLHPWHEDIGECVAFARWYWEGAWSIRGTVGEILDFFEKPWHFEEEYQGYKEEQRAISG